METQHVSVMLQECLESLAIKPSGVYVDGTLGGAGHSGEIGRRLSASGRLIGIDRDEVAIQRAQTHLNTMNLQCGVTIVRDHFSNLRNILHNLQIEHIDGFLLDLGVSSFQLDEAERGFSYMQDGPLDMRMDQRETLTAKEIVNTYSEEELAWLIREYGEEKWAKRIAVFIVKARQLEPVESSSRLVEIIKQAIPAKARKEGPHPAKRTFQAIRMEVNQELQQVDRTLETAAKSLSPGGRIAVISFHSLEDRLVKNTFKRLSVTCVCPPEFPECRCQHVPLIKLVTRKPLLPTHEEVEHNPRSRSAKLRVAERI
ncbi:16S rRNA (cytosine(1402)-N(4))-methyltransferase RsmH [Anoxynatronum sibiricum]|uniref:Ribosomal RNA small subunit methyltransferase H n=1 Tax=Anoxynatronum sibiricum TaxID=210623 RepID=A0ABU9VR91_9CLOT